MSGVGNGAGTMECYSCRALSGERRISPGPIIHDGEHWVVEHAYPCGMVGWLVIVLKRHLDALHEMTSAEFTELAGLMEQTTSMLHALTGCQKEYVASFGEANHFNHIHFHIAARASNLAREQRGTAMFKMLNVSPQDVAPVEEVVAFCEQARDYMQRG